MNTEVIPLKKLLVILLLTLLAAQAYAVPPPKPTALPKIGVVPSPKPTALPKIGVVHPPKSTVKPKIGVVPSPKPTVEPKTDALFDYDALIKTPDDYFGWSYTVVGKVVNVFDAPISSSGWEHGVGVIILVDGRINQSLFFIYDARDETPVAKGENVRFTGKFGGTEELQTMVGYIQMPFFIAGIVDHLS